MGSFFVLPFSKSYLLMIRQWHLQLDEVLHYLLCVQIRNLLETRCLILFLKQLSRDNYPPRW